MARGGWLALLTAVSLPHLSVSLGTGATTVLMPLLQRDLHLSTVEVGWIGGIRFVSLVALSLPMAALVTRLGLGRSMVLAQIGFGVGLAVLAAATTAGPALLAVASGGIFLAATNPATTTAVMVRFPAALRAQAMNTKQVGVPLGQLAAALMLPPLALVVGWRVVVLIVAGIAVATALATHLLYTGDAATDSQWANPAPAAMTVLALLRHRPLMILSAMQALSMGAQATLLAYFAVFFVERGLALPVVAGYIAVLQLSGTVARLVWGPVARYVFHDRPRPALAAVVAVSAVGVAALAALPPDASTWAIVAVAVLLGLGIMGNAGMIEWVRGELLPASAAAAATGVGYTIGAVGATVAPPLLGVVAERAGFSAAWAVCAAILVIAVVLALRVPDPEARRA
jgi:MFS family permease